ncbi:MAG: SH3 domain-containing protein [Leptolyngbyaceae cyanobacterium CRU_2_3]|nr:SH3 domain-containing protein [Leptolyngbyaceae cyanobacterium CRU_2_3]
MELSLNESLLIAFATVFDVILLPVFAIAEAAAMETKDMTARSSRVQYHPLKGSLIATALSVVSLSACSVADLTPKDMGSIAVSPSASATISPAAASPSISSEFSFPQISCGDQATSPSETWYPVYIDKGDIAQIRSKYCKDAVRVIRDKTGIPSVQVASFTSAGKAQRFAAAVGGQVEPVGISRASLDAQVMDAQATGERATGSALSTTSSTSAFNAMASGESGVLVSRDSQAPINIRDRATTTAPIVQVGYGGDRIQIVNTTQAEDGYTWYSVQLESGEKGWVRGDFVNLNSANPDTSAASDSRDRSLSASAIPSTSNPSTSSSSTSSSSASINRSGVLTASEPGSLINVRSSASTSAEVQSTGYVGDRIQVTDKMQGDDGYTWYSVRLESGGTGWVRSDFVSSY